MCSPIQRASSARCAAVSPRPERHRPGPGRAGGGPPLPWYANPPARFWSCPPPEPVRAFHALLPDYAPSPLVEVPWLARDPGVGRVLVKDESSRLGLPAFKALGASWAIHQILAGAGDSEDPAGPGRAPRLPLPHCAARPRRGQAWYS